MNRCAIVTGASRGLGRAVALELARRGYSPVGVGFRRDSKDARAALAEVERCGAGAVPLQGDLADPAAPGKLVEQFLTVSDGRLDLLANNAAEFRAGLVMRLPEEDFDRQLAVNLSAAFRMMRAAGQALTSAKGAVINVSSIVASHGGEGMAAYAAAKAGLEGLTRVAATEWGAAGVRVNAVIPGFMAGTGMGAASDEGYAAAALAESPLGRAADPAAVAAFIVELAEAADVTGQVLSLDGRVRLGPPMS